MGTITELDAARPHRTHMIKCKACGRSWCAVYPVGTKGLECPGCHGWVNEHGTPVLVRHCKTCGSRFTVCPTPEPENLKDWEHCLSEDCASYEEARNADKLFDAGLVKRDDEDSP